MPSGLKKRLKLLATRHLPSGEPNVFIHSLPRSGSTWLMELILTQPGFMSCNEPLNLDKQVARDHLGLSEPIELHHVASREKIGHYLESISSGRLRDARFNRPAPFSEFYRPVTRRVVFKILHGGQEHINWLARKCNGRVVVLMRHPIPVAQSRNRFPKFEGTVDPVLRQYFTETQLAIAERIACSDDKFAKGLLDWCLQISMALRYRSNDWAVLTYEQLVLDPLPVVNHIAKRLELRNPELMIKRLAVPSQSTALSDRGTREVLNRAQDESQRKWLVEKWRKDVDCEHLVVADDLLATFELNSIYRASEALPEATYWIG